MDALEKAAQFESSLASHFKDLDEIPVKRSACEF